MVSWSSKRQLSYLGIVTVFLILFLGVPSYFYFKTKPSCFDGIQNQGETGVDCGGPCDVVCPFEVASPSVNWGRSFYARDGIWSAAAYIENPNDSYVEDMRYRFRLLDSAGALIAEKEGSAFVPPRQSFVIFEPAISVGNRTPTQTFFEFLPQDIIWLRAWTPSPELEVSGASMTQRDGFTRLSARIHNPDVRAVHEVRVAGIIYDPSGNAIRVSETYLGEIAGSSTEDIVFTWPGSVPESALRTEIVYTVLLR